MGLTFTPTSEKSNISELDDDLNEFFRKIRLQEYFYGQKQTDISLVRNRSNFNPPPGRNLNIETYISTTKTIWANIPKEYQRVKHNITLDQRKALKSLSEDKSIIIKEADKGGGIVLMNVEFYKNKILEMLNNELYYYIRLFQIVIKKKYLPN